VVGWAGALGPEEFAVGGRDGEVVDAGFAAAHEALVVELPELVAEAAPPLAGGVVRLVDEADGHAVFSKAPEFLAQAVFVLASPLGGEELDDGVAAGDELVAVAPAAAGGVGEGDRVGVAGVPGVLGLADFEGRGFEGEGCFGFKDVQHVFNLTASRE
jgi:hypothetical protein